MRIPFRELTAAFAFATGLARAEVHLAPIFSDHMILQRDLPCAVAGRAEPGERIVVRFSGQTAEALADADGRFVAMLPPMPAQGLERELSATAPSGAVTIKGVQVGDVWLCSGQSNMEWPMSAFPDLADEIAAADLCGIRLLRMHVADDGDKTFDDDRIDPRTQRGFFAGSWEVAWHDNAGSFSAVAFTFARHLRELVPALEAVPIGLVQNAIGGSPAEAWMSREDLADDPDTAPVLSNWTECELIFPWCRDDGRAHENEWRASCDAAAKNGKAAPRKQRHRFEPTALYDAGIAPLAPFRFKGVLWYQGESNAHRPDLYGAMMPRLIARFRSTLGDKELPFLFVQLAGYGKGENWMLLREEQDKLAKSIPRTGMAVAIDLGDETNIHPARKGEVGRRLALLAAKIACGNERLERSDAHGIVTPKIFFGADDALLAHDVYQDADGPRIVEANVDGVTIIVTIDHAAGLTAGGRALPAPILGFEIAGEDREFHSASATLAGSIDATATDFTREATTLDEIAVKRLKLALSSSEVRAPKYVRYAWAPNPLVNLVSWRGLPLVPFRTDR